MSKLSVTGHQRERDAAGRGGGTECGADAQGGGGVQFCGVDVGQLMRTPPSGCVTANEGSVCLLVPGFCS